MLEMKFIRENPDVVRKDLKRRKDEEKLGWIDDLLKKDEMYRKLQKEDQELRKRRNEVSESINKLKKEGKDASELIKEAKNIPGKLKALESEMDELKGKIDFYLMRIPNIMHESVPYGADDSENVEVKNWGKPRDFDFKLKSHGELLSGLGLADFRRAAKVSGAGFYYLLGDIARLDWALMNYAIDHLIKKGFTIVEPPVLLGRKGYEGVTDLQDFEDVMYKIEDEDLYLIATSEHPIGAMLMDEVLEESELPLRLAGVSPCFRKEIGSHGVDTKGLFRVHQFNKIEQFVFCRPEESWAIHEDLLANAEELFQSLGLPYRVVNICTGDLGIVAAKKYDIEAWYPRQEAYKEVVSCSNCTAYQAVRLNVRYQKGSDREFVHTLNSTAIATSRALVAVVENYQNKDGTIDVPEPLRPYMGGKKVIGKRG